MSDEVPEQYLPRLCHVVKWDDFQGYGFNLHAEKGKAGQYIGKVDENSPAEAAGLKEGDRIVEVNGVNIGNENHQQVVSRIKAGGEETRLLVVDSETDDWYKEHKRIIRGDSEEVRFISSKRGDDGDTNGDKPAVTGYGHVNDDDDNDDQHRDSNPEPEIQEYVATHVSAPVHNGSDAGDDDSYRPRLCHLKIWPHFQGYGFNLHAEKDKPGQFIGLVDDNSPASTAGLRVHDRIVEVNGANVEDEKHTEVIARIKAIPGETKLLVVDKETDNYCKEKGIAISSSLPQTQYIATPDAADLPAEKEENEVVSAEASSAAAATVDSIQHENDRESDDEGDRSQVKEDLRDVEEEISVTNEVISAVDEQQESAPSAAEGGRENEEKSEDAVNGLKSLSLQSASEPEHEFTVASQARYDSPAASSAPAPKTSDGLELNLSVAEMKERLKAKKRQDPRMSKVSFEQKYKEFQRM